MNASRVSFARTLPILVPLLSYVIIAVIATMAYVHLRQVSQHGRGVRFHSYRYDFVIQPKNFLATSIFASAEITSHTIQALNGPGFVIEFGVDRFLPTRPNEWVPSGMKFTQWRAFILPVCCLPFWWFAGMGIDALTARKRRSWWVLLLGSILWTFIGLIAIGLRVSRSNFDNDGLGVFLLGLGLWFVLLSAFPIAWVKQWLAHRRIRTTLHARLSAETQ